jgi:myo-inositol-1(or 4)-monophosphatase
VIRSALLNVMMGAARKAARNLVRDFGEVENLQVSMKGPSDFVSQADIRAEKTLVAELRKGRPDYGFLLEEGGAIEGADKSHRWVIDPLDGTTNFIHGIPHFAISIGLLRDGEPVAGVIYNPINDEMFHAEKGAGAFVNERRLRVAARRKLEDCVFTTGIPHRGRGVHGRFLKEAEAVMAASAGLRRFGSASLDMAYVAAGRCDGYWESDLLPWDIAAGIVMVREAGGVVSDLAGEGAMLDKGEVLASNLHLHESLGNLLRSARS